MLGRRLGERRLPPKELERFCRELFLRLGLPAADAGVVAESLVRAELEGAGSHGLGRLPVYARRIREGRISARPEIRVERSGAVLRVDGGNGLGQVVCYRALEAAVPVARELGIAGVAVRKSNHFGAAAYYCQIACEREMALIATTNSPPGIAPWGGRSACLGTNPIAFGFPARDRPPLIADLSSSVVARGRIMLAAREGRPIPEGWAIDRSGRPTTDPEEALRGAVLPFGGAKGYALALAVEALAGVLSGASTSPEVGNLYRDGDPPADVGHLFILVDIGRWMPLREYYSRMERLLGHIKASPKAKGEEEILYPGERRYRTRLRNSREGVWLGNALIGELEELAAGFGVAPPGAGGQRGGECFGR